LISFEKQRDKPGISFGDFRYPSSSLVFDFQLQERLKERYISRIHAMISIVESPVCRNIPLLHYFGEELLKECGMCDICLENKKVSKSILTQIKLYSIFWTWLSRQIVVFLSCYPVLFTVKIRLRPRQHCNFCYKKERLILSDLRLLNHYERQ
jgi:hypothetical protein